MALVAPPMADFRGKSNSAVEESHIWFRFVDGRVSFSVAETKQNVVTQGLIRCSAFVSNRFPYLFDMR